MIIDHLGHLWFGRFSLPLHSGELLLLVAFFVFLASAVFHWLDPLPRDDICREIYSKGKKLFFFFLTQSSWAFPEMMYPSILPPYLPS